MIASRRRFLFGAGATLIAAPAIVRVAANLMPVSTAVTPDVTSEWVCQLVWWEETTHRFPKIWSRKMIEEALESILQRNALFQRISERA